MRSHKPNHGSLEIEDIRRKSIKFVQENGADALTEEIEKKIVAEVQEHHRTRVLRCHEDWKRMGHDCHPFHCECHWCAHDEEFDDHPEDCPACQAKKLYFRVSASWSTAWLIADHVQDIISNIEVELDPDVATPASKITIEACETTEFEWQRMLLNCHEFEGFES